MCSEGAWRLTGPTGRPQADGEGHVSRSRHAGEGSPSPATLALASSCKPEVFFRLGVGAERGVWGGGTVPPLVGVTR